MSSKKGSNDAVRVMVRVRPFNNAEITEAGGHPVCTLVAQSETMLTCVSPQQDAAGNPVQVHNFPFDYVLWSMPPEQVPSGGVPFATQVEAFQHVGIPSLESAFEGYNGCIFAYGQTSSGKTHSMMGYAPPQEQRGIVPRLCEALFSRIDASEAESRHIEFSQGGLRKVNYRVEVSFLEIYNEKVLDLLRSKGSAEKALPIAIDPKHGPVVKGLTVVKVSTWPEVEAVFDRGQLNRSVAATAMNERSSRSHAIVQLIVTQEEIMGKMGAKEIKKERRSRINLVDLAGSEKVAKSKVEGANLKEAIGINQSLTCLGRVIDHLIDSTAGHIPYRDSVLTHLLSDSLGGNSRTTMLAALSPAAINYEETLSTLRYASRARKIVNVVKVNEDPAAMLIHELQEELLRMKEAIIEGNIQALQDQMVQRNDPLLASKPLQQVVAQRAAEAEDLIAALQQRDQQDAARLAEREQQWAEENEAIQQRHLQEIQLMQEQQQMLEEERRLLQAKREELETDIQSRRRDHVMAKFSYAAKIAQAKQQQQEAEEYQAQLKRELALTRWRSSSQKAAESGWKEKAEGLEEELAEARRQIEELSSQMAQMQEHGVAPGGGEGGFGAYPRGASQFGGEGGQYGQYGQYGGPESMQQEPVPGILAPPCEVCMEQPAQFKCCTPPCDNELLCVTCDANQHRSPLTSEHIRYPLLAPCDNCGVREAVLQCVECGVNGNVALMCQQCDDMRHKNHARKLLIARACEFCGMRDFAVQCLDCPNGRLCQPCDEMKHRNPRREFHRRSFATLEQIQSLTAPTSIPAPFSPQAHHQLTNTPTKPEPPKHETTHQHQHQHQHQQPHTQQRSLQPEHPSDAYSETRGYIQKHEVQVPSHPGVQVASVPPPLMLIPPHQPNIPVHHQPLMMPPIQHSHIAPPLVPVVDQSVPFAAPYYPVVSPQRPIQHVGPTPTRLIRY